MVPPNYYQLLGLRQEEHAYSAEQIKKAYRKALLSHHPDKTSNAGVKLSSSTTGVTITVDQIALAYKTLSEPSLRAEYDRWLASNQPGDGSNAKDSRIHHTGLETVDLDDLAVDDKKQAWTRSCRCGVGGYVVTEEQLEKNIEDRELIVGCEGCSLWLRVLFSVEE